MGVPGNANALLLRSAAAAGGYQVSRSLRFNSADSAYLNRTPASAGNRKTWTWSAWVKRSKLGEYVRLFNHYTPGNAAIQLMDSDKLRLFDTGIGLDLQTTQVFRDVSAWYHFVAVLDTTQATASNRAKLYVNGTQITAFSTSTYPSQNADGALNNNVAHTIGSGDSAGEYFNGYLAECHFIGGSALDPSSFGETDATTGQWIPKLYSGSYGTNGFKLTFADNSAATAAALGKDTANSNNWTPNNFSVTAGAGNDSLVDTPTSYGTDTGAGGEVRGNYCTWNPLWLGSGITLSNGNLDFTGGSAGNAAYGTIGVTSGKWYYEVTPSSGNLYGWSYLLSKTSTGRAAFYASANYIYWPDSSGVEQNDAYGSGGLGSVIGIALDLDNYTLVFYKDGVSQGSNSINSSVLAGRTWYPLLNTNNPTGSANFGQRPWAYAPPSGFKALCDTNLPAPVIAKPNTVMDVLLWTGNGSNPRSLTGLNFNPDLVWSKDRNGTAFHRVADSVRGTGNKQLYTNSTDAENAYPDRGYINSFDSSGFTVNPSGSTAGGFDAYNTNATTYVAWCWDGGTSTVTNTQGSITSSVRANASAGFSIVTWTGNGTSGATVGHGLNVTPSFYIVKNRSNAWNWAVYHSSLGNTKAIFLNLTDAPDTGSGYWNNAGPSSTTITLGAASTTNQNTANMVAYVFSPVAGYSSFGRYEGNGSADGPFVYTGFRPKFILIKPLYDYDGGGSTVASTSWYMYDSVRGPYNGNGAILGANKSYAEENNATDIDFLSNGFKLRNIRAVNAQGTIYAAWAESPFQYSRAR